MSNSHQDPLDPVEILQSCVEGHPFAWQRLVDQYLGTIIQVIDQIAESTSLKLSKSERELTAKMVFEALRADDFELIRRYREYANFETFLILVTRRVIKKKWSDGDSTS